jgi:hypothetical protein
MPVTAGSIITPQAFKAGGNAVAGLNVGSIITPTMANTNPAATAGPNGARLTRLTAITCGTVSAAFQVLCFSSFDAGVTGILFRAENYAAYTLGNTIAPPLLDFGYSDNNPLMLAPNEQVRIGFSLTPSTQINFFANWMDY